MFQRQLKIALKTGNVFINEDDLIPVIVKASAEIDTYVKGIMFKKCMETNCERAIGTQNGA